MGRPRKLREETEVVGQSVVAVEPTETKKDDYLKPFRGKESLEVNVPQFFINGRKIIRIMKTRHCVDANDKPHYKISRTLYRNIPKGGAGDKMKAQLRQKGFVI